MTAKTAQQLAEAVAEFVAVEHGLIAAQAAEDPAEVEALIELADTYIGCCERVRNMMGRGRHEILTGQATRDRA